MLTPQRALVRPRAISPISGDSLPLEELVAEFLEQRQAERRLVGTIIQIAGGPGSGKSTALSHLAAVLSQASILDFRDDTSPDVVVVSRKPCQASIVAYRGQKQHGDRETIFSLAPWTRDDLLEYLLAAHPQECPSVLARIRCMADFELPQGNPELWRAILDEMAADPSLDSLRSAVERAIHKCFDRADDRWFAEEYCLATLAKDLDRSMQALEKMSPSLDVRLLRHPLAMRLVAANGLVVRLWTERAHQILPYHFPADIIREAAPRVAASEPARQKLRFVLSTSKHESHATAASLLVAAGDDWRPVATGPVNLRGGYFGGVQWSGVVFPCNSTIRSNLWGADFSDAHLSGAILKEVIARETCFRGANLQSAQLTSMEAYAGNFAGADFSGVSADRINLKKANLAQALLAEASLRGANLEAANLAGARFVAADLTYAILTNADIEGADFQGANLQRAVLHHLPLRKAHLDGADFSKARLQKCDLEGVDLPDAQFSSANLSGAWLTGSKIPRGNFAKANLRDTGLAGIHWEDADLQGADLRGCSFHMGSTRCGLVGSPYPMEGSKTGFYTDDYHDQSFKRPEEIRKANLCGADLRGANLDHVDFYLVDLRDAKFDPRDRPHLQQCGAILKERCPE